jgi:ABC-type enterobactin transport system permease subunit
VRPTLALLTAVLAAVLTAYVLGEYELTPVVSLVAGLVVGFGMGELLVSVGRWRGLVPAALAAVLAAAAVLWAGWIDSGEGVEPYPTPAYLGAAVGAVTAAVRTRPRSPATG